MVGENIRKIRTEKGMTQKALADMLYVTPQAVSRWENGEVEPSVSTVLEIAKIFQITTDELLGTPKEADAQSTDPSKISEESDTTTDKEENSPPPSPQQIALCEVCNHPIYDASDIHREFVPSKRGESREKILCTKCSDAKKAAALREANRISKKKRILGMILGSLFFALSLIIGIYNAGIHPGEGHVGFGVACGIGGFSIIVCWVLENNFIGDMMEEILSWSFVTFPGIIFSFDIDGCLFLIGMKILFKILGLLIGVVCGILAFAVGSIVSPFVLPFALVKNIRHPELTDI